ncbi:unnamed protein product [Didymodactylos carnosus]|uniref:Uncharacterized protein n=1 Tax=Didymodactylos carnosus TaxID=1234261 RepID=A0A813VX61_9BILA|nr:unnamed protein product [Didymodactylos carnosus]CAF0984800.1 unnamed protein product [Didymodactylos carnosus]CAF3639971.1 unnamed protein product [Didymodactylos carnosus]CAF3755086.1 unnamed protein product [Didymodactylos carnosus]
MEEHRLNLDNEFQHIVSVRDMLHQEIDSNSTSTPIVNIDDINRWENEMIKKVKSTAANARETIIEIKPTDIKIKLKQDTIDWNSLIEITTLEDFVTPKIITFDNIPKADEEHKRFYKHEGFEWVNAYYVHSSYAKKIYPGSGYINDFINGSKYIVRICDEMSISRCKKNQLFNIYSFQANSAWSDILTLEIRGLRNGEKLCSKTVVLQKNNIIVRIELVRYR